MDIAVSCSKPSPNGAGSEKAISEVLEDLTNHLTYFSKNTTSYQTAWEKLQEDLDADISNLTFEEYGLSKILEEKKQKQNEMATLISFLANVVLLMDTRRHCLRVQLFLALYLPLKRALGF
jgi:hypothetical protein